MSLLCNLTHFVLISSFDFAILLTVIHSQLFLRMIPLGRLSARRNCEICNSIPSSNHLCFLSWEQLSRWHDEEMEIRMRPVIPIFNFSLKTSFLLFSQLFATLLHCFQRDCQQLLLPSNALLYTNLTNFLIKVIHLQLTSFYLSQIANTFLFFTCVIICLFQLKYS